jgi:tetratricopeptide repeat protein/PEGA domain-containing protein
MVKSRALNVGLALALGCGMSTAVNVARAQAADSAVTLSAEVDAIVQRGIELRRVGREEEALAVFESALAKSPGSTRVKVHLAATHQALGQWIEAERYLSDVLQQSDDPYIRRHRATLDKAYAFVDGRLGSLDVVGGPEGAELVLSGRTIGQLPLSSPVRVPIGSYVLEVRKEGYYSVSRPVAIGGGSLLRESIVLGRRAGPTPVWTPSSEQSSSDEATRGSPRWLTWTLGGAGLGAAAVSVVAFGIREKHAARWNGADCLSPGLTRGQACPEELDSGRSAERWGIGAGIVSGVLLGGAAASLLLERSPPAEHPDLALDGCGIDLAGAHCFGSF